MSRKYRYILGIQSYANNDSGACIVRFSESGDELDYVAISEERLIRKKYPFSFPLYSVEYCMDHFGIKSLSEVDLLVGDFIRTKRWNRSGPGYSCSEFDYLKQKLDFDSRKIVQISHHMAHAASTFYTSGFDEAAILIVDGNGTDLQTTSFLKADNGKIRYLDSYKARGIGEVYAVVTKEILNLGEGGEGKTMGLAPFGKSYDPVLNFEGSYDGICTNYSKFMRRMPTSDVLNQVDSENCRSALKKEYRRAANKDQVTEPYFARVAFEVQEEAEKALVHLGKELYAATKCPNICVAGGVALNSVANKIMFDATDFEKISVFPACSDSGIPFGLAVWGYYNYQGFKETPKRKINFRNAYTGTSYAQDRIDSALEKYGVPSSEVSTKEVAKLLSEGNIIGWFQGASEYGPRSLGNRSILADSRREEMKDLVNIRVKHRETYRPFAPAVLLEHCAEYFDIDGESPFMLLVADAKKPDEVPATIHVDNTARVQTVTKEDNGIFYDLINDFKELTGVPVILNTSFNDAGEPIVETPEDAIICFLKTEMDYLVLGNRLIKANDKIRPIADKMVGDRKKLIADKKQVLIEKFCPDYDENERNRYIRTENDQAKWHVTVRPKYNLEQKVLSWVRDGSRVLIVGTKDHTDILLGLISGFNSVNIVGFVDMDEFLGRNTVSNAKISFSILPTDFIGKNEYDAILISSFEFQYELEEKLKKEGVKSEIYSIYDNACRGLMEVFTDRPFEN
jgi:carbamoyltransferase